ncbi:unnamed protein product [Prorocentrum cordatum]|uniref:Uncharacterized protein n=1 Tax=Prorocentrum cordatum TaxID=2364126 RepID=A0ABN9W4G7_9DINO|nr:unnamed protein product [Polarella glacialis]
MLEGPLWARTTRSLRHSSKDQLVITRSSAPSRGAAQRPIASGIPVSWAPPRRQVPHRRRQQRGALGGALLVDAARRPAAAGEQHEARRARDGDAEPQGAPRGHRDARQAGQLRGVGVLQPGAVYDVLLVGRGVRAARQPDHLQRQPVGPGPEQRPRQAEHEAPDTSTASCPKESTGLTNRSATVSSSTPNAAERRRSTPPAQASSSSAPPHTRLPK